MKWLGVGIATVGMWGGASAAIIFGGEQIGDMAPFSFFFAALGTMIISFCAAITN